MSAHTPGPWRLGPMLGTQRLVFHDDTTTPGAASSRIAGVTVRMTWEEEQEANARLICAAPDLLAVAKHAQEWTDPESVLGVRLAEVIAKATGEKA